MTTWLRVCIPARNEQARIGSTLAAIARACNELDAQRRAHTRVTIALDSCTDATEAIVAELAETYPVALESVIGVFGSAAAARNAAVRAQPWQQAARPPQAEWIAMTDADTIVPPGWLKRHEAMAHTDLVLGTVEPDARELSEPVLRAWRSMHRLGEGHDYVHGANMGFDRALFERLGGFSELVDGEDVDFAERARAAGARVLATDELRVVTSARLTGRAPLGFSGFLRDLTDLGPLPHDGSNEPGEHQQQP